MVKIISLREDVAYVPEAIDYINNIWGSKESYNLYKNCIETSISTDALLPWWYVVVKEGKIIGCVGLITNDFISRMDLYPWLCALYVDEKYRNEGIGAKLIDTIVEKTKILGFKNIYLCTDLINFYEKYGFSYIGEGYHPWGESSRIYKK